MKQTAKVIISLFWTAVFLSAAVMAQVNVGAISGAIADAAGSGVANARATAIPSIDAVAEFKVETNNLSAEYGRLSGGAVNIQTRSGANEYHGSLYDFARDDVFNANSWDANRRGSPRGSFTLHQFGGTLGAQLETQVANPFAGAGNPENGTLLTRPTIQYKYLLRPQPHLVGDVRVLRQPRGNSTYLAGYFKVERRLSNGLSVLVSYTLSKLIEDTPGKTGSAYSLPQDGVTLKDIRGHSTQDAPHKLVVTYLYELPFGKGKRFLGSPQSASAKAASFLAGG